jgi:phage protein D
MKSLQGAKTDLNNAEVSLQQKQAALKDAPEADKATSQKAVEDAEASKKAADAHMDLVTKQVNVQSNRTQGLGQLMQSTASLLGGIGNFVAESARAEAKAYESQAQYEQSLQQADQAFFQQLGDAIRNMMQNWQSIESATHQANQAIYNV